MDNTNYLFSLKVDGTELSIGGDKEFVVSYLDKWLPLFKDKIPNELLSGDTAPEAYEPPTPAAPPAAAPPSSRNKMSLADFVKMKSPKNYNDFALTVFFYHERYEGLENVGVSFDKVVDFINKLPNHPSREEMDAILETLIESNFVQLMPGSESDPRYQVTFTGEQCVKQGFEEE